MPPAVGPPPEPEYQERTGLSIHIARDWALGAFFVLAWALLGAYMARQQDQHEISPLLLAMAYLPFCFPFFREVRAKYGILAPLLSAMFIFAATIVGAMSSPKAVWL